MVINVSDGLENVIKNWITNRKKENKLEKPKNNSDQ